MLHLPTAPWAHYVGDAAAWLSAAFAARWQYRANPAAARQLANQTTPGYFIALALGGIAGAWLFGSANSLRGPYPVPSHSIAGALAGAIAAVELWKWRHGIRASTGGNFVLPLATGIAVGRLGCLFAGLPDSTYGTATTLPWGIDLGDGIARHPVQLYESATMALFAYVFVRARARGAGWANAHAFHSFIIVYAAQRFVWEFLKPYPPLLGSLNVFHLLMIGLIGYGLIWYRRSAPA